MWQHLLHAGKMIVHNQILTIFGFTVNSTLSFSRRNNLNKVIDPKKGLDGLGNKDKMDDQVNKIEPTNGEDHPKEYQALPQDDSDAKRQSSTKLKDIKGMKGLRLVDKKLTKVNFVDLNRPF